MNSSSDNRSSIASVAGCRVWKEAYHIENYISTMASIILNMLTCPMTVFINALVIVAVIKKHRLQTAYNMLLACLAGTDLVVGIFIQPSFIVGEMYLITGPSLIDYCRLYKQTIFLFLSPSLASLLLLALLSIERYLAMKYSLRYMEIVTKFRLKVAVIFCWTAAIIPSTFAVTATLTRQALWMATGIVCVSLLVIIYCHILVFLVTRRHKIQIQAEQVSQDAKMKFSEDKKAAKTTSIIIGFVLFSYVPSIVYVFVKSFPLENYLENLIVIAKPLWLSFVAINSLCNPIIYCWRSSVIREACLELLRRSDITG